MHKWILCLEPATYLRSTILSLCADKINHFSYFSYYRKYYVNNSGVNRMCFLKFQRVTTLSSKFITIKISVTMVGSVQRQLSTAGLSTMFSWGFGCEAVMMDKWSLIFYHKYLVNQGDTGLHVSSFMYKTYIRVSWKPGL